MQVQLRAFSPFLPIRRWVSRREEVSRTASKTRWKSTSSRPPLFELQQAIVSPTQLTIQALKGKRRAIELDTIDWTVGDSGKAECWAIVGPATGKSGDVKTALIELMTGARRPQRSESTDFRHPPAHPFLSNLATPVAPAQAVRYVSFANRLATSSSSTGFQDYSVRYGAIRDEDKLTYLESLMELQGVLIGNAAKKRLAPDPLTYEYDEKNSAASGRFKWSSREAYDEALARARVAKKRIDHFARILAIDPVLLDRPLIALSNGQTRRARILRALLDSPIQLSPQSEGAITSSPSASCQMLLLEEPFSGLDPSAREILSIALAELHSERSPRIVLILREQDGIPSLITHILSIDGTSGKVLHKGPLTDTPYAATTSGHGENSRGGYDIVRANVKGGVGAGDKTSEALVRLQDVTIEYSGKSVLKDASLEIFPGTRMCLVGDNGSGKSTLLSLILGDNPRSYSLPASSLSLFGSRRLSAQNATALLNRRTGHLSPELFAAFPRLGFERGGMSVLEVVGCGFEGIFTRRALNEQQKRRVVHLLALFSDVISARSVDAVESLERQENSSEPHLPPADRASALARAEEISQYCFADLGAGSQAVVVLLRAVVHSPQLLCLDEPFQGMDSAQLARTRAFLDAPVLGGEQEELWLVGETAEEREADKDCRRRQAIVLVSHYEKEWIRSLGALVRLSEGKVIEKL